MVPNEEVRGGTLVDDPQGAVPEMRGMMKGKPPPSERPSSESRTSSSEGRFPASINEELAVAALSYVKRSMAALKEGLRRA